MEPTDPGGANLPPDVELTDWLKWLYSLTARPLHVSGQQKAWGWTRGQTAQANSLISKASIWGYIGM